jgi:hypothetical protein
MGRKLAGRHVITGHIEVSIRKAGLALVELCESGRFVGLCSATARSSMALASAAVPNWPCAPTLADMQSTAAIMSSRS